MGNQPGCPVLALALVPQLAAAVAYPLHLLMWNPHWQCFAWDQHNCTSRAENALGLALEASDADFATIVELGDDSYLSPSRFTSLTSKCGRDLVTLIHNERRWRPAFNASLGCMIGLPNEDRPFVVQTYERILNPYERVTIAGAHYPHPDVGITEEDNLAYRKGAHAEHLREALKKERAITGVEQVVLIADTNAWDWVDNREVMETLGVGPRAWHPAYLGTTLSRTCCYDVGFPSWGTFDRIIANFGKEMTTSVLFEDTIPSWAEQVHEVGGQVRKGAFHKPVVGMLLLDSSETGHQHLMLGLSAGLGAATVLVCLLLYGAGTWISDSRRGPRHLITASETDSSESE